MSSSKEYKDFILEQLRNLNISCRPMMNEYILYLNGTLFGGIYDNRLLIKKTKSNKKYSLIEAQTIDISGGIVVIIGNAPGSSGGMGEPGGRFGGGPGGMMSEGSLSVSNNMTKTQSSSKGLSSGNHTIIVNGTTISYYNAYTYSGYTTIYASSSATIN